MTARSRLPTSPAIDCAAGSRPATDDARPDRLAGSGKAPKRTAHARFRLDRANGPTSLPRHGPNSRLIKTRRTAAPPIPIAPASLAPHSRAFVPWRLSNAGPRARGRSVMGRHPKPVTGAAVRND